jgi:hypothetical protein
LRGVESELDSGLVSSLSKVGEQVSGLLLGGIDDLARGCLVDGIGNALTELLEAVAQSLQKILSGKLGLRVLSGGRGLRVHERLS